MTSNIKCRTLKCKFLLNLLDFERFVVRSATSNFFQMSKEMHSHVGCLNVSFVSDEVMQLLNCDSYSDAALDVLRVEYLPRTFA